MNSLEDDVVEELCPGRGAQPARSCAAFVRDEAWGHHASCTAAMGPRSDPRAVVDSRLPGARHQRAARRRRLGLPAHPRLLHRHRDLHGGREGQRRHPRRRRAAGPAPAPSRTDLRHVLALLPRPRKPSRTAVIRPGKSRRPDEHRDLTLDEHRRVRAAAARRLRRAPARRRRPASRRRSRARTTGGRRSGGSTTGSRRRSTTSAAGTSCPCPAGLAVLIGVRNILRQKNLHDPSTAVPIVNGPTGAAAHPAAPGQPQRRRLVQRPRPPDDGHGRRPLRPQHPARPGAAGDPRRADGAQPARGQPPAAHPRRRSCRRRA